MSKTWSEERTNQLVEVVGDDSPVSRETVEEAAVELDTSVRSIASKLRNMGYEVQSAAEANKSPWTEELESALSEYLEANNGKYTYNELAASFDGGTFTSKSIQGKILSMEMTDHVKPAEKPEVKRVYSDAEQARFIEMAQSGASIEAIAEALNRTFNSVRGKALALSRSIEGFSIPHQAESHAKNKVDFLESLGDISEMTVEEIAEATGKTPRGIKGTLTRRKLSCADYDGAKKAAKRAQKEVA